MSWFSKLGNILKAATPLVKEAIPGNKEDAALDAATLVVEEVTRSADIAISDNSIKAKAPIVTLVASLIGGKKIKDRKKFDSSLARITKAVDDLKASLE
jgi:hypothetical protein